MNCPYCNSNNIGKRGFLSSGKQRFLCKECKKTFTDETIIKEPLTVNCPYCASKRARKGGFLKSGKQRYICKECGKYYIKDTIIREAISESIKCPDCNSHDLRRCGKSAFGAQRYLCKSCGRKFVEEVSVRPTKTHQVMCPKCGNHYAQKAGHTGSHAQYWKCLSCGTKFLENPRFQHTTEDDKKLMISLVYSGFTPRQIGERIGKTGRTVKSILESISTSLKEHAVNNILLEKQSRKSARLKIKEDQRAAKQKQSQLKQKKIAAEIIRLFNKEGLTQKQISRKLHVSVKTCSKVLQEVPSKAKQLRQDMLNEVFKGKPAKEVAKKYNYNYYSLNKLLKPLYLKETITDEQKQLIIKYGYYLKVPINYLAEYVPCSERKCYDILSKYKPQETYESSK